MTVHHFDLGEGVKLGIHFNEDRFAAEERILFASRSEKIKSGGGVYRSGVILE